MIREVCAANGSRTAVEQSGTSIMSDSLIAFHPAIDEPSNITPSLRKSSLIVRTWCARCCHLPRGSVNRKSTYLTSCSLIISITFWVSDIATFRSMLDRAQEHEITAKAILQLGSDRIRAALAGADPDCFLDCRDEDLTVTNTAGMRRLLDGLDGALDEGVFHHYLDLHLGQEINHVFRPAIKLGMTFLPAETLGLGNGNALDADFMKRFLHFVELEGFDY